MRNLALGPIALQLPQHPDEHRPEGSILLAVDQELSERAALRVAWRGRRQLGTDGSGRCRVG